MSTNDDIKTRIALHEGKRLFHLPMLVRGDTPVRTIFVSEEINDAMWPESWPGNWMGYRQSEFRTLLDAFTKGEEFSVSEKPKDKPPHTDIARVCPVSDEIWSIRCTNPNARIRCLGCFGAKDLFIGLTWQYREDLKTKQDWEHEINRCKKTWTNLFDLIPRYKGATLDDYLSAYISV